VRIQLTNGPVDEDGSTQERHSTVSNLTRIHEGQAEHHTMSRIEPKTALQNSEFDKLA